MELTPSNCVTKPDASIARKGIGEHELTETRTLGDCLDSIRGTRPEVAAVLDGDDAKPGGFSHLVLDDDECHGAVVGSKIAEGVLAAFWPSMRTI